MTDAPRITHEEAKAIFRAVFGHAFPIDDDDVEDMREALAAFLRERVPQPENAAAEKSDSPMMLWKQGFNACRDLVLRGRG